MDRVYAFPKETKHFHCFSSDKDIKQHVSYRAAKAGDAEAALQLVDDVALEFLFSLKNEFPEGSVFLMKSKIFSEYTPRPSPPTKQVISSALEPLTRSEIDALRQKKRQLSAYYQKIIQTRVTTK